MSKTATDRAVEAIFEIEDPKDMDRVHAAWRCRWGSVGGMHEFRQGDNVQFKKGSEVYRGVIEIPWPVNRPFCSVLIEGTDNIRMDVPVLELSKAVTPKKK